MAANSHEESDMSTVDQLTTDESLSVVFQCSGCNNIFGDSCAWVSSNRELEVICLNSVSAAVSSEERLETSTQGADLGSTFMPLQCKSCNTPVGRIYKTTPRELDNLRNLYCLDVDCIKSYQFGSVNGMQTLHVEDILDLPQQNQKDINKIKGVIVMLLERLTSLEEACGNRTNADDTNNLTSASTPENNDTNCSFPLKDITYENDRKPNKKKRK